MAAIPSHDAVVALFNELGYQATFGALAEEMAQRSGGPADPAKLLDALYSEYPSREALGEEWLLEVIPSSGKNQELADDFCALVFALLARLQSRRDFARAWIAAMALAGPLHLRQCQKLHDCARGYFLQSIASLESRIPLPGGLVMADVQDELADVMAALTAALLVHWEMDRSLDYRDTCSLTEAAGYLLDALLIARDHLGERSLLVCLHTLAAVERDRFLAPVLDMLLPRNRTRRLADPLSLLELLRSTRTWPAERP